MYDCAFSPASVHSFHVRRVVAAERHDERVQQRVAVEARADVRDVAHARPPVLPGDPADLGPLADEHLRDGSGERRLTRAAPLE